MEEYFWVNFYRTVKNSPIYVRPYRGNEDKNNAKEQPKVNIGSKINDFEFDEMGKNIIRRLDTLGIKLSEQD